MPEDSQQRGPACRREVALNGILQDSFPRFCVRSSFRHATIITDLEISSDYRKYYANVSLFTPSRLLQPMCREQRFVLQNIARSAVCYDLAFIHHDGARE